MDGTEKPYSIKYAHHLGKQDYRCIHLAIFHPEDILPQCTLKTLKDLLAEGGHADFATLRERRRALAPDKMFMGYDDKPYIVRMESERYELFKKSLICAACGLEGVVMMLDMPLQLMSKPEPELRNRAHFNLYGILGGSLILFTKDHIIPRSKGGPNSMRNYQTMCTVCNNKKGNHVDRNPIPSQNNTNTTQSRSSQIVPINTSRDGVPVPVC